MSTENQRVLQKAIQKYAKQRTMRMQRKENLLDLSPSFARNLGCIRYERWLEKRKGKGNSDHICVLFESNAIEVTTYTWWIESGATVHVINSLKGLISKRPPSPSCLFCYFYIN